MTVNMAMGARELNVTNYIAALHQKIFFSLWVGVTPVVTFYTILEPRARVTNAIKTHWGLH